MRFAAIYGYLWITSYSSEKVLEFAKREWSKSLQEFENQVLKMALEKIKKTQPVPPSLPLFFECCTAIKKSIQGREEALKQKSEVLKRTDPKVVQLHISKMKEYLSRNSKKEIYTDKNNPISKVTPLD